MTRTLATPFDRTVSRRTALSVGAGLGLGALVAGLSGCGGNDGDSGDSELENQINNPPENFNPEGFPIVDETITVGFMTGKRPLSASDYNKVASWKKYQEMTNITIDWGLIPNESIEEKRNLALNSGDHPAAFHSCGFGANDLGKYGRQGVFLKLNELIDAYMPNLKKVMEDYPDVRKGMTFPEGGAIYGMPLIYDPEFTGLLIGTKLWVRGDWLETLGMEVPTTTQEYHQYLTEVHKSQPGGKGKSIGYCDSNEGSKLRNSLMGSFGVGNRGPGLLDATPGDEAKVRFISITDEYRELLEYQHQLYAEKLMAENIFSIDETKYRNQMREGGFGSSCDISPGFQYGKAAKNFVPVPALKGPHGEHAYNNIHSPLAGVGNFVLTDKCEHPVEAARWMDYFYSDEGAKLFFMGVEGESYRETDNGVEYLENITDDPDLPFDQALKPYSTFFGGGYPGIIKEDYFKAAESTDESTQAAKLLEPDAQNEVWSTFTFTQDESDQLDGLADDIEKYVEESTSRFVAGDMPLSDWGSYVDQLKKMGLDDYVAIQQAAYDRYQET